MKTTFSQEPEPEKAHFTPQPKKRGRPAANYWDMQSVMAYIADYKFSNLFEYKQFVEEQGLQDCFPLSPNTYYKDYAGVDAFLGNPPGTAMKRVVAILTTPENRAKSLEKRRENKIKKLEKQAEDALKLALDEEPKVEPVQPVVVPQVVVSEKPSVSLCLKVLMEHNVSFSTLNKAHKEMKDNITLSEASEIVSVLLDFLTKQEAVKA